MVARDLSGRRATRQRTADETLQRAVDEQIERLRAERAREVGPAPTDDEAPPD